MPDCTSSYCDTPRVFAVTGTRHSTVLRALPVLTPMCSSRSRLQHSWPTTPGTRPAPCDSGCPTSEVQMRKECTHPHTSLSHSRQQATAQFIGHAAASSTQTQNTATRPDPHTTCSNRFFDRTLCSPAHMTVTISHVLGPTHCATGLLVQPGNKASPWHGTPTSALRHMQWHGGRPRRPPAHPHPNPLANQTQITPCQPVLFLQPNPHLCTSAGGTVPSTHPRMHALQPMPAAGVLRTAACSSSAAGVSTEAA